MQPSTCPPDVTRIKLTSKLMGLFSELILKPLCSTLGLLEFASPVEIVASEVCLPKTRCLIRQPVWCQRKTVYHGPGFLAAVRVLSTCHEDEELKQPSGATPVDATAITSGNESGIFSFEDEIIVLLVCPFPAELCH